MVGVAEGGGFQNTNELRVMKYEEVMSMEGEEKRKWDGAINEEHRKMEMYKVFQPVRGRSTR